MQENQSQSASMKHGAIYAKKHREAPNARGRLKNPARESQGDVLIAPSPPHLDAKGGCSDRSGFPLGRAGTQTTAPSWGGTPWHRGGEACL